MRRSAGLYLADMIAAANEAMEFVEGMSFEDFCADRRTVNAVIRAIEVLGEAAKCVADPIRARHGNVPWREISGMRDKLIHFYHGVDLETVWLVVKERLPKLVPILASIHAEVAVEEP